jgi:hypothetical protein
LVIALTNSIATHHLTVASGYCTVPITSSSVQLILDATKTAILQPYIGLGKGLIPEIGGDAETGPDRSSATKPRRKTRVVAVKQLAVTAAAKVTTVKAVKKKKRKKKASPPPAVETPVIPTPQSREVESKEEEEEEAIEESLVVQDRSVRRSLSPAAMRQRELVEKTTDDDLRQILEVQRAITATREKMPVLNRPWFFRP